MEEEWWDYMAGEKKNKREKKEDKGQRIESRSRGWSRDMAVEERDVNRLHKQRRFPHANMACQSIRRV